MTKNIFHCFLSYITPLDVKKTSQTTQKLSKVYIFKLFCSFLRSRKKELHESFGQAKTLKEFKEMSFVTTFL